MREKRILLALTVLIAIITMAGTAQAATTLGVEKNLATGGISFDLFGQSEISDQFGWFGYFLVTDGGYSEAYLGPTWAPISNLEIGLGYGIEAADDPGRFGGYVWTGKGKASLLCLYEDGGSGPWHRINLGYQVTPKLYLGVSDRSFYGKGALIWYKLDEKVNLQLNVYEEAVTLKTCLGF